MSRDVAKLIYSRRLGSMLRKTVLAYMAERASKDGSGVWASKRTIALDVECSKQAVINTVKQFTAEGILIEKGKRKTQGGYTFVYDIDLDVVSALPERSNQSTPLTSQHIDQSTPLTGVVNPVDPDQSTPLTQTVLEPSLNLLANANKCAREKPFPKPDWADAQVWKDFIANRKAKKQRNTATAYKQFLTAIEKHSCQQWPPPQLLEYATGKGWGSIHKPTEEQNERDDTKMGTTERAARQAFLEITGSASGFGESAGGGAASNIGAGDRIIDAQPDIVRAIGHG